MALGRRIKQWAVSALALLGASAAAANTIGLVTLLDGPAEVLRGGARFEASEGTALQAQDIVLTLPGARLARLETSQGTAIDLGPATQLLLHPAAATWPGPRQALGYLVTGWIKISAAPHAQAPVLGIATTGVHITPASASVVLVQADMAPTGTTQAFVFAERGQAELNEYGGGVVVAKAPPAKTVALAEGQAYRRSPAQAAAALPGDLLARASATALSQVPAALRETLPLRAARFANVTPPTPSYQSLQGRDLSAWQTVAEPLRSLMAKRFAMPVPASMQAKAQPEAVKTTVEALLASAKPTLTHAPAVRKTQQPAPRPSLLAARPRVASPAVSSAPSIDSQPLSMLLERDAISLRTANAVKPGEAATRGALPETNTRLPETALMTVSTLPAPTALAALPSAPAATPTSPRPYVVRPGTATRTYLNKD
jgi:hypothetical protein